MMVLVLLLVALGVALTRADSYLVTNCVVPLVISFIVCHIDRNGDSLAEALVLTATRLLPRRERPDWREEWLDHVRSAREQGLPPLSRALSILLIGAPALAVGLRVGRVRKITRR